jgi:glucuronate isomerase
MTDLYIPDSDRFFDPDTKVRSIARELYEGVRELPIVSPHGHVDPRMFAFNHPYSNPAELIIIPDHYIFRMLYSQGIPLERIGVPRLDGCPVEADPRKIWQLFGDNFYLYAGTPTDSWLSHEFYEVFGIREKLTGKSAMRIYDAIQAKLETPEFLPRALFDRFGIEVLSTTDSASDSLEHHRTIRESGWKGRIIPCFRPDAAVAIANGGWRAEIMKLSAVSGIAVDSYRRYIQALENRRTFFISMGATATDHGVFEPFTRKLTDAEAEALFARALTRKADSADQARFTAHMLMEFARMSIEDGLVMQLHPGSFRDHNTFIRSQFGPDKGCDIPVATEFTRNLHELLNAYGNDTRLTLIVFTLDESVYSRELAPLAGHYPAMKLGPAWWFNDSIEGMLRYRRMVTETAGIYNTAGFNDDTRAFPSIPARHDLSRRVDCTWLAGQVARHIIDRGDAERLSRELAGDLARKAYKLK